MIKEKKTFSLSPKVIIFFNGFIFCKMKQSCNSLLSVMPNRASESEPILVGVTKNITTPV